MVVPSSKSSAPEALSISSVEQAVSGVFQSVTGSLLGGVEDALVEAGIDSLASVQFCSQLARQLGFTNLPGSLIYDYPTAAEIAAHLVPSSDYVAQEAQVDTSSVLQSSAEVGSFGPIRILMLHGEAADSSFLYSLFFSIRCRQQAGFMGCQGGVNSFLLMRRTLAKRILDCMLPCLNAAYTTQAEPF